MTMPDPSPGTLPSTLVSGETLARIEPIFCSSGTLLFQAGDPEDLLYVILSGEVEFIENLGMPDERIAWRRGAGEVVGELSVLIPRPRPHYFSARVSVDASLLVLQRSETDSVLRHEPLLAYEMVRVASGHLHHVHRQTTRDLREKNAQLEQAYAALREAQNQLLAHERVRHELQLARELQQQMIPRTLPQFEGIYLGARTLPAYEVGGDFYDLFAIDDDTLGIVIGDVCGKGMPAALYMAQTRSLIRAEALRSPSPAAVLRRTNRHLRGMNSGDMFVTTLYGRLYLPTRTLVLARAGHEYPLRWAGDGGEIAIPRAIGQPLGILDEPSLDEQSFQLDAGETFLLYTDGVTDLVNVTDEFFDATRLRGAVHTAMPCGAQALCDELLRVLLAYQRPAAQADDITLLVVQS